LDIDGIYITTTAGQKIVILFIKNPQDYIDKIESQYERKMLKINYKIYDSPIIIAVSSLHINFDDLCDILTEKAKEHDIKIVIEDGVPKKTMCEKVEAVFVCIIGLVFVCTGIFIMMKDTNDILIAIASIVFGGLAIVFGILELKGKI
jgi:hypothetical protein